MNCKGLKEKLSRMCKNCGSRGATSFAEDQFLKILPSSNYGTKELKDAGLHA